MRQREDIAALVGQKKWRADTARRIIDAFEESGLRARAFSHLYGFNEKRVSEWKLRLGRRSLGRARREVAVAPIEPQKQQRSSERLVRIVPVRLRSKGVKQTVKAQAAHLLEVQTPSGCVLRVPSEFDGCAVGRMLLLLGVTGC